MSQGNRDTSEEGRAWEGVWKERGAGNEKRRSNRATNGIRGWRGSKRLEIPPLLLRLSLLTSLKGLGMAESISTLMKESSPSAERLELSAEGVWEMTRLVSLFLLLSDSSFLFCWTNAGEEFL